SRGKAMSDMPTYPVDTEAEKEELAGSLLGSLSADQIQEMLRSSDPTIQTLLLERGRQRQDIELLNALRSNPKTPPELQEKAADFMVEVLANQAEKQGPTEETFGESIMDQASDGADSAVSAPKDTAVQRLSKMTVSGKLRVALFGSKEERFILIKS